MEITREIAKQQLEKTWTEEGDDPDFAGLHQGPEGTAGRHKAVLDILADWEKFPKWPRIADVGCGTGLLLKSMFDRGMGMPSYYLGFDFIAYRERYVNDRLTEYDVTGRFVVTETVEQMLEVTFGQAIQVVVAIGIMGYPGLHTLNSIAFNLTLMKKMFKRGVVTVPKQLPERLGETEMARYDPVDLAKVLNGSFDLTEIYTDTIVSWC